MHHLTSRGNTQPALFGLNQRLGRCAPLHVVRFADASCQSLVGYGDQRNHRHTGYAGNHDPHVYAARQLGAFANRSTNAQHNDPAGPDRAGNSLPLRSQTGLSIKPITAPCKRAAEPHRRPGTSSQGQGHFARPQLNQTTGAISGTPTAAGTSSFTVRVEDAAGNRTRKRCRSRSASLPPNLPNITTTMLLPGTVGQPYSQPVQVTGGTGALTWSIVAGTGTLPQDLNLNQVNGVISGTPTAAGTSPFTVRVQDAGGLADTQALSITINQPAPPPSPSITTTTLPAGTIGQFYNQTLQATGGTGGLTWSIVAGICQPA